jgi:hypothetical protein
MDALFPLMGRRGRSSYEAKIEIGHKLGPLNNCCRHRNIFLHNVYRIFTQTIRWRLNGRSPGPLPESAS